MSSETLLDTVNIVAQRKVTLIIPAIISRQKTSNNTLVVFIKDRNV